MYDHLITNLNKQELDKITDRLVLRTKKGPNGCIEIANVRSYRYGRINVGSRTFRAHRVSFMLFNGPIDDDLWVLHTCDNPACVKPSHLVAGTPLDNSRDCTRKGRQKQVGVSGDRHWTKTRPESIARGERHGRAKLTAKEVAEIRLLYSQGGNFYHQLAKRFNVSKATIVAIVHRKIWI